MDVLYDVEFMLLYDGTAFVPQIKAQKGKQLVVKWLRDAHVFDRYLDVVNDRFHYLVSPSLSTTRVLCNGPLSSRKSSRYECA
jgi:hypothetical protein